jgi:hypothetical protein
MSIRKRKNRREIYGGESSGGVSSLNADPYEP